MAEYGRDLVLQLVDNPEYRRASDVTVPPQYNVANESPRPMFLQVDFGLVRNARESWSPSWLSCRLSLLSTGTSRCWRSSTLSRMDCLIAWGSISAAIDHATISATDAGADCRRPRP